MCNNRMVVRKVIRRGKRALLSHTPQNPYKTNHTKNDKLRAFECANLTIGGLMAAVWRAVQKSSRVEPYISWKPSN